MNKVVFESIIEITSQRDSDSLPGVVLLSLARILCIKEAMVYSNIAAAPEISLKQTLKLINKKNFNDKNINIFNYDEIDITINQDIDKCITKDAVVINNKRDTTSVYIPVFVDTKLSSVLHIVTSDEVSSQVDDIYNLIKVYENNLTILIESESDKLTGLFNRRTFDNKLNNMLFVQKNKSLQRLQEYKHNEKRVFNDSGSAWLAMIDIDYFKNVNDEYGHVAGDEVLLRLSQKMQACFRNSDLLFRFGGEEFVVVLEPIPKDMVQAKLDKFRNIIEEYSFPYIGKLTISIGYAKITESDFPATILDCADKALYYAKDHGRNSVYNYESLLENGELDDTVEAGSVDLF